MSLADLLNKQFEPVVAPVFVPSFPEVRTKVKRAIVPGTSKFMPAGSLRQMDIEEELSLLNPDDVYVEPGTTNE